ncbi:hypothetical protein AKJ39_02135, partial [candidate division MSBL1 archaeon SCGC-AAA259J03]
MERDDESSLEIGAKSTRAGFVTASVLLVLLSIYEIIETGEFPPALGVLGLSLTHIFSAGANILSFLELK